MGDLVLGLLAFLDSCFGVLVLLCGCFVERGLFWFGWVVWKRGAMLRVVRYREALLHAHALFRVTVTVAVGAGYSWDSSF